MCSPLKGFLLIFPLKARETREDFDFISPVCSLSMRCDAHCGDNLSGMMHTTEIISVV